MDGDRQKRRGSSDPKKSHGGWIGRTLKLESQLYSRPRSVEISDFEKRDLTVIVEGEPPAFGETVQLSAPGARGAKARMNGEVILLERIRGRAGSVKIVVQLREHVEKALAKLPKKAGKKDAEPSSSERSSIDDFLREYTSDESKGPKRRPAAESKGPKRRPAAESKSPMRRPAIESRRKGSAGKTKRGGRPERSGVRSSGDSIPAIREERKETQDRRFDRRDVRGSNDGLPTIGDHRTDVRSSSDAIQIIRDKPRPEKRRKAPARARPTPTKGVPAAKAGPGSNEDFRETPRLGVERPRIPDPSERSAKNRKRPDSEPVSSEGSDKSSLGGYSFTPKTSKNKASHAKKRRATEDLVASERRSDTGEEEVIRPETPGGWTRNWAEESSEEWPVERFDEPSKAVPAKREDEWPDDWTEEPSEEWPTELSDELAQEFAQKTTAKQPAGGKAASSLPPPREATSEPAVIDAEPAAPREKLRTENLRPKPRPAARAPEPKKAVGTAPPKETGGRDSVQLVAKARQIDTRASSARPGTKSKSKRKTAPVVGIDFGTTYSKIALLDGDEVVLIEDRRSYSSTRAAIPSVVGLSTSGSFRVGESAREMLAVAPDRVISSIKRVVGLNYTDPLASGLLGSLACPSKAGPNDSIVFELGDQEVTVPDVIAKIIEYIVELASDWVGMKITQAVMTVPVDFDARAQRELELAAKMAGIEVLEMIPEPVAAVMGVGFDGKSGAVVSVFDFGGGTFDASIVEVGDEQFQVLGSGGDRWLGGDDLDDLLAKHTADIFNQEKGISLHNKKEEFQRLVFACEETKRLLSALDKVDVIMPDAATSAEGPVALLVPVSREDFDDLAIDLISSSLAVCDQAIFEAERAPDEVDALLLTGGTSRVPVIRTGAERFFGLDGIAGIHPEHAVVIGAAVKAALVSGEPVPEDFARKLQNRKPKGQTIGIIQEDGTVKPLFEVSQSPPLISHHQIVTSEDNQKEVKFQFVLGKQHDLIGQFVIDDLPELPAGEVILNLFFELTSTMKLHVIAQELETGQRYQTTFDL